MLGLIVQGSQEVAILKYPSLVTLGLLCITAAKTSIFKVKFVSLLRYTGGCGSRLLRSKLAPPSALVKCETVHLPTAQYQ